ncbi:cutinase family protein [Mycobacterium hodleri]|uniref:Cutinase family protein n=1 Tax=Mycolicibacterium hodleri TaxID=49897 RepID=A0A544W5C0_9MYCO|nr:cutinase family protein [Mycolicibacterium hodleri]
MKISAAAHGIARSRTCGRLVAAGLSVIAMLVPHSPATGTAEAESDCPYVQIVFARGTFEQPGVGATGQAFVDALSDRLGGKSVGVYAANYPASLEFSHAAEGVVDVRNKVESLAATCPETKILLGGYSQGAAVVGYTLADTIPADYELPTGITGPMPAAMANHVAAVALFGTPGAGFMALVQRDAPPITIGNPYLAKTIQLCAAGDPVCSPGGRDRPAHSAYKDNGMAVAAAEFAVRALSATASA